MPEIYLLIALLLGIVIMLVVAFMAIYSDLKKVDLDSKKAEVKDKRKGGPF